MTCQLRNIIVWAYLDDLNEQMANSVIAKGFTIPEQELAQAENQIKDFKELRETITNEIDEVHNKIEAINAKAIAKMGVLGDKFDTLTARVETVEIDNNGHGPLDIACSSFQ